MMPVHYFVRIGTRERRGSGHYSRYTSKSDDSSEDEDLLRPPVARQRSRSIGECIYQFFGLSGTDDEATDDGSESGPVFGNDLEKVLKSSETPNVPVLVEDICSIIKEKHLFTSGLYSVFAKKRELHDVIRMAKFEYSREKLEELEPPALAGLLKAFLKGLKNPVLGVELAGMIITIGNDAEIPNAKKMRLFARQRRLMSEASQATTYYLIQHFNEVLGHKKENELTLQVLSSNFVTSFFPNFAYQYDLKQNPAPMNFLIVYSELIFPPSSEPFTCTKES